MNRYQKDIIYAIFFGIIIVLNIIVNIYRQPIYNADIVKSDFQLITRDGIELGWAFSTISLRYQPRRTLGKFILIIKTEVSESRLYYSIFSNDVAYRVSFWWKSRLIEQVDNNYLGALAPNRGREIYSSFILPSSKYPMNALESVYWKIVLTVEGAFYNMSSNEILAENVEEFSIFIIHPSARLVSFLLLIALSWLVLHERSGPILKNKNIWEKSRIQRWLKLLKRIRNN